MEAKINMIGIITSNFTEMYNFYKDVMGFKVKMELESFVEFESEGVRFAISTADVMAQATGEESYKEEKKGHSFELAFNCETPLGVDESYNSLTGKGAKPIKAPADMPWGQRTAFFADPDDNIHEVFTNLPNSNN